MTTPPTIAEPNGPPSRRGHVRLAWALCSLVVGLSAAGFALTLVGPNAPSTAPAFAKIALDTVGPVVFGVVAALIVAHQPRNTIGWLLMLLALGVTTLQIAGGYLPLAIAATPEATPAILLIAWFSNWSWWLLIGPLLLILLLFPTASTAASTTQPRCWRPLAPPRVTRLISSA